jgi:hypothetical protein
MRYGRDFVSEQFIDTVTRHAAGAVSRRASLLTLGGMALATMSVVPAAAKGEKKGKKRKKHKGSDGGISNAGQQLAQAKCASQGDQCRASVTALCEGDSECLDLRLRCCDFFATCNGGTGLVCIFT